MSAGLRVGDEFRLLFTGLPYYGPPDHFESDAKWRGVPVGPPEVGLFRSAFNDYCTSAVGAPDPRSFLSRYLSRSEEPDGDWRLYYTMLLGMNYAHAELAGAPHPVGGRTFRGQGPTTWVTYLTFRHRPRIPAELDHFLEPCANRPQTLAAYTDTPDRWGAVVRVRLPPGSWWAYLLTRSQADWFATVRRELVARLSVVTPGEQFATAAAWRAALPDVPIAMPLLDRLEALLPDEEVARHTLPLPCEVQAGG